MKQTDGAFQIMKQNKHDGKNKRTIQAPSSSDATKPGAFISVDVDLDQDVEWIWTHYPDGRSAVTGYRVVQHKHGVK